MTNAQRLLLERIAVAAPVVMTDNVEAAVAAALADLDAATALNARLSLMEDNYAVVLADLDACRAALGPVAAALREQERTLTDRKLSLLDYEARFIALNKSEADAVLAAAGEEPLTVTAAEAQAAYDAAPSVPMSPERIREIVDYATGRDETAAGEERP